MSLLRSFLVLSASVLWCGSIAAQGPTLSATPPGFARAHALQQAGDLEAAAAAYAAFLADHPENIEARSNLGVVLANLGRTDDAVTAYREALQLAPSRVEIRLNLGLALYKSARLEEASAAFGAVLEAMPSHLQARYLRADCDMRLGRPEAVITSLEPLNVAGHDDRVLAYLLGMAYLRTRQLDRGQLLIDRILRDGGSAEAHLMLGLAKRAVQDLTGGLADLRKAVELNPELPSVHALYGQALLETGNRDEARAAFESELQRNPTDFEANLFLGVLDKEEQRFDTARRFLTQARALRPQDIGARFQLAAIHLMLGETAEARTMLEAIVEDAPAFVEARVSLATVYYRLKRRDLGDQERDVVERLVREQHARQASSVSSPP